MFPVLGHEVSRDFVESDACRVRHLACSFPCKGGEIDWVVTIWRPNLVGAADNGVVLRRKCGERCGVGDELSLAEILVGEGLGINPEPWEEAAQRVMQKKLYGSLGRIWLPEFKVPIVDELYVVSHFTDGFLQSIGLQNTPEVAVVVPRYDSDFLHSPLLLKSLRYFKIYV